MLTFLCTLNGPTCYATRMHVKKFCNRLSLSRAKQKDRQNHVYCDENMPKIRKFRWYIILLTSSKSIISC